MSLMSRLLVKDMKYSFEFLSLRPLATTVGFDSLVTMRQQLSLKHASRPCFANSPMDSNLRVMHGMSRMS